MTNEEADNLRLSKMTQAMREADRMFTSVDGTTRHHVRDCLLPILKDHGLVLLLDAEVAALRTPAPGAAAMREALLDVARAAQEDAFESASRHYGSRYRLTVDLDRLERIVDSVEVRALHAPAAPGQADRKQFFRAFPEDARRGAFRSGLERLINRHSIENDSDTPDFQLSKFLMACLLAYEDTARSRDAWFKFKPWGDK